MRRLEVFEQITEKLIENPSISLTEENLFRLFKIPEECYNIFNEDMRTFECVLLKSDPIVNTNKVSFVSGSIETWTFIKTLWYFLLRTEKEVLINISKLDDNLFDKNIKEFLEKYIIRKWISIKVITTKESTEDLIDFFQKLDNCKLKIVNSKELENEYIVSDWMNYGIKVLEKWEYIFTFNCNIVKKHKKRLDYLLNKFENNFKK